MKKITAFIGSQRKQATYGAVIEFEEALKTYEDVDFEIIFLKDYRLENCSGCKLCFTKGEENCPLQDDRDLLIEKISNSDGVIIAAPNYSFHVPAAVKNLFDRLSFIFHRPRFFGKTFTSIVTQGMFGGDSIVKYLGGIGENFGFKVSKGCVLNSLEPTTDDICRKNSKAIRKAAARYHRELSRPAFPAPSLFRLMLFRMSRTNLKLILNDGFCDYRHYREKGWFKSDYYYDAPLGLLKKAMGLTFDFLGRQMAKNR